jgi:nitrogen fixation NifU-like protein
VLYLRKGPGDVLAGVHFEGHGCTVSQAGASMIAELATGRPLSECEAMGPDTLGLLMGRDVIRSRAACAGIGLDLLRDGLHLLRAQASPGASLPGSGGGATAPAGCCGCRP